MSMSTEKTISGTTEMNNETATVNEATQQPAQLLELPKNYGEKMPAEVRSQVEHLVSSIDVTNRDFVTSYGVEEQTSLGRFADTMLSGKGSTEIGETGTLLNDAMNQIKNYDGGVNSGDEKPSFFGKIFGNPQKKIEKIRDSYRSVDQKIEIIVSELASKKVAISKVYDDFDDLFDSNKQTYMYLTTIIYAGEQALSKAEEKLKEMQKDTSADPQDIRDYADDLNRFSKRLYDLKMTRAVAISLAPQIRSVQKSAQQVEDSINTAINISIPMWKTQMAIALGMQTVKTGLDAANQVTDVTNQMFLAVSQAGKDLAVESAKASQRGVIDIDTVRKVNQNLIDSLTESTRITQEGIKIRKENEQELKSLETNLSNAIKQIN